jgi:hypothetical protein
MRIVRVQLSCAAPVTVIKVLSSKSECRVGTDYHTWCLPNLEKLKVGLYNPINMKDKRARHVKDNNHAYL